ncbi:embryonic polarity protein dorsal-like isoform X2 [Achroia grisella]|nr:embryonic polarity protein dorsal-like isoform X2 [Achroia grisella]XP_059055586.1 embryonic polarity protein dorsal-like isoform X2 [Achroia grisella]XP_059055587.1 embryonic polarity protein dorsal-like isoform X2 [Achroia grisella]
MPHPPAPSAGPYTKIVEQPAGKALRFRYECEGRSAGSIPGVNSTPENRTYPTIKICGYRGRVVIVVSCITKEDPYKPHPHNLVGRDCHRGVCTVRETIDSDTCQVQFKNLGIQCVKRRDIAEALRVREELRVDPFRTRYAHKNQPQSIDLNAVRLCFQVFMTDDTGKVRQTLTPVVSDVIYDKKAMSELQIAQISHCSGSAKGGTRVILLCEKVNREDTAVVFFQEENKKVVWEERAHIEAVHKLVAIVFQTPPYRHPNTTEHVTVQLQLQRLTDNARSSPVSFEYIPARLYSPGARKPLPDLGLLARLLDGAAPPAPPAPDTNNNKPLLDRDAALVSSTSDSLDAAEPSSDEGSAAVADINGNLEDEAEPMDIPDPNEKSLNDLLDQVAELDEIYSENRTRLENVSSLTNDHETDLEDFNDAGTYTSLQLAFKNPVQITEPEYLPYEDVQVQSYRGPTIEFTSLKREPEADRAPPLPPKRVRKPPPETFKTSQTSVDSILKPGRQLPITRNPPEIVKRNRTELSVARSEPALPPVKKRSFFSRLFRRKEKSPAPSVRSEGKKEKTKPVGRSISSVSGVRPAKFKSNVSSLKDNASATGLSYADSVTHISLHGDDNERSASAWSLRRPASLAPLPPTDGDTILVAESVLALDASSFKKLQDDLDLTEAEHYALYMAVAPHATVSEFDETSCYYSPVDGSKFQNQ